MLRSTCVMVLCASGILAGPAGAVDLLTPVSQARSVSVTALAVDFALSESDQQSDSLAAPDFGLFDFDTVVDAVVTNAVASASGLQVSEVLGDSILAAGAMSATADSYNYEAQGQSSGASRCEVVFDVAASTFFTLAGSLSALGTGASSLTLDGPSGTLVSLSAGTNQTTPVAEAGSLEPGTWTFGVTATGSALADFFVFLQGSASYDLSLVLDTGTGVPAPAAATRGVLLASPNPFRDVTWIRHDGSGSGPIGLAVFDVRGRVVRELTGDGGSHAIPWDGRNAAGRTVPPGVYFIRWGNGLEIHDLRVVRVR